MVKAREFQKNIYFCFIDYTKTFDCVDHNKLWKILKEMGIPDRLTCLLRKPYAGQEQQLEPCLAQWTGSKLGKEYVKAVHCHPAYFTYIQSTSCGMPGWMTHKLESRLPGRNINSLRYTDDTTLMAESEEELKNLLMRVKRRVKKLAWNSAFKKLRSRHLVASPHVK